MNMTSEELRNYAKKVSEGHSSYRIPWKAMIAILRHLADLTDELRDCRELNTRRYDQLDTNFHALTDEVAKLREQVKGLEQGKLETCDAVHMTSLPHRFCRLPKGHEGNCEYV